MKKSQNELIVLESWRRCAQAGLAPDSTQQLYPLSAQQLGRLCEESRNDISAFERCVTPVASDLPKSSAFLLVNAQGILLKKIPDLHFFRFFRPGFSFSEAHAGTNAIALSLRRNEPMQTLPHQNYCTLLTGCVLYSAPFSFERSSPTLAVITNQKQRSDWPPALLRQLISSMAVELQQDTRSHSCQKEESSRLTARQRTILLHIAGGMTDRQTAADLHITQETVQYHKKNLYRQLDAENAVQAVVKALRLGLLSLEEIPV